VTGHDKAGHVCDPIDRSEADTGEPVPAARSYRHDLGHEGIDAVESVRWRTPANSVQSADAPLPEPDDSLRALVRGIQPTGDGQRDPDRDDRGHRTRPVRSDDGGRGESQCPERGLLIRPLITSTHAESGTLAPNRRNRVKL
jgi:hypothetical protein